MSRIVPPPQVVITPVSEFKKSLTKQELVQTTITQTMNTSNSSSEDDDFEKKPPKPDITPSKVVTPPPKKRVKKESPVKRRTQKKPKKTKQKVTFIEKNNRNLFSQGDLVFSTAKEIGHPAYKNGDISGSYLFFGCVTHIVTKDDPHDDEVNVHWMTIHNEKIRYVDAQSTIEPYTTESKYTDRYVSIEPLKMPLLKVLLRRDDSDLSYLNDFIAHEVNEQYSFDIFRGWVKD